MVQFEFYLMLYETKIAGLYFSIDVNKLPITENIIFSNMDLAKFSVAIKNEYYILRYKSWCILIPLLALHFFDKYGWILVFTVVKNKWEAKINIETFITRISRIFSHTTNTSSQSCHQLKTNSFWNYKLCSWNLKLTKIIAHNSIKLK